MHIVEVVQDDFNELYYGMGLDRGLTPDEFVAMLKEAVDVWLATEGVDAWSIYNGDEENARTD